jgi:hypothetical protein
MPHMPRAWTTSVSLTAANHHGRIPKHNTYVVHKVAPRSGKNRRRGHLDCSAQHVAAGTVNGAGASGHLGLGRQLDSVDGVARSEPTDPPAPRGAVYYGRSD